MKIHSKKPKIIIIINKLLIYKINKKHNKCKMKILTKTLNNRVLKAITIQNNKIPKKTMNRNNKIQKMIKKMKYK